MIPVPWMVWVRKPGDEQGYRKHPQHSTTGFGMSKFLLYLLPGGQAGGIPSLHSSSGSTRQRTTIAASANRAAHLAPIVHVASCDNRVTGYTCYSQFTKASFKGSTCQIRGIETLDIHKDFQATTSQALPGQVNTQHHYPSSRLPHVHQSPDAKISFGDRASFVPDVSESNNRRQNLREPLQFFNAAGGKLSQGRAMSCIISWARQKPRRGNAWKKVINS